VSGFTVAAGHGRGITPL